VTSTQIVDEVLSTCPRRMSRVERLVAYVDVRATPLNLSLIAGLVCLGIGCYQLSLPHVLSGVLGWNEGYDDGVYLGAATRFVHGALPYRDFIIVHPPWIVYLMAPVALVGRIFGTLSSLEIARCLTVVVVALNAMLAGLVVRSVGRLAVAIAAFSLALWPLTVGVDRTLELEPYLVLFCLLGAILVFDGNELGSWRRVLFGGLAFGFAGAVKIWAVLPIIAVLFVCFPKWRSRGLPLVLGIALGAVVPCLPFLVIAPHAFYHDVIVAQSQRQLFYGTTATPLGERLLMIAGLGGTPSAISNSSALATVAFVFLGLLIAGVYGVGARRRTRVEWFVLVVSIVVFVGMFESALIEPHYAYFPAVFLALLLGVCVSHSYHAATALARGRRALHGRRTFVVPVVGLILSLSVTVVLVVQDTGFARAYLSEASDPSTELASVIPPGACVLSDYPSDLLVANRYVPSQQDCPAVVDPLGTYLADDDGSTPHPSPPYATPFLEEWFSWLQKADYVELRIPFSDFLPWTNVSIAWFQQNYRLVAHFSYTYPHGYIDQVKYEYIYKNISARALPMPKQS
jgi:alpha-1,2-mannosyltransferase